MSNQNYSLEIISHHPTFKNKSLRKYYVDGIDTVGAWGDEPFEIKFTNHSWQKVQVKISVDGTDVLSGKPATTEPTKEMWVVNGYGTLSLKAWPESDNGGAAFVFTSANNSVAIHTHGDLSSRGIVAAAVYTEGHVEPIRYNPPIVIQNDHHHHHYIRSRRIADYTTWGGTSNSFGGKLGGTTYSTNTITPCSAAGSFGDSAVFNCSFSDGAAASAGAADVRGETKSLESLVSVGAGQHVDQRITHVVGLIKPTFTETCRVRYMWWDDLVSKLREHNVPMPHASGFPADQNKTNINLGNTPRLGGYRGNAFPREATPIQSYLRV